jgi:sucrose-6-phosphate hydrolase SacC (GH32 family)
MNHKTTMTLLTIGVAVFASGCAVQPELAPSGYQQSFRPQLSYSPARNWMNDPNGLVYHDGEYHLFYQYNPNGSTWGDMSWGHAVSADLVHWQELPLALTVEKDGQGAVTQMFFSGSVVVDEANTNGLGQPGRPAMIALYTSVYPQALEAGNGKSVRAGTQAQSLAYSLDRGRSWTQYAGNPVIALPPAPYIDEYREFRDPKVFWYEPEHKWVMVLALPNLHKALFYTSRDLLHWDWMSEFGPANAVGGAWECPDLIELPVDGDVSRRKWVLVMSLNPGGPAGGSGTQYFIGKFDGTTFAADPQPQSPDAGSSREPMVTTARPGDLVQWLDYGADFYAAVSWNGVPGNRRIMIGWMNNWLYGQQVPTAPWRSAQSVPRELSLRTLDGRLRLVQQPVAELQRLRMDLLYSASALSLASGVQPMDPVLSAGGPKELEMRLKPGKARRAGVRLRGGVQGQEIEVGYDSELGILYLDRSRAGDNSFLPGFSKRQIAPVLLRDGQLSLRILLDSASVTVFAGEGETVLTSQIFPDPAPQGLSLFSEGASAELTDLKIWALSSIWARPE